jgi:hypothetical protein
MQKKAACQPQAIRISGSEQPGGDRALARREPQARGLYAGGIVGGLAQAEEEAADHEAHRRHGKAMRAGRHAPQQHRDQERAFHADLVDKAPLGPEAHGIADLEPEIDIGVVLGGPVHGLG